MRHVDCVTYNCILAQHVLFCGVQYVAAIKPRKGVVSGARLLDWKYCHCPAACCLSTWFSFKRHCPRMHKT